MTAPKAALFDLDDTLAESFKPPTAAMVEKVAALSARIPVAIISGASFERMREEILDPVAQIVPTPSLFAFPDSASIGYTFDAGVWHCVYSLEFEDKQLEEIKKVIESCAAESGVMADVQYEPKILLERTQVRYAALGLNASEADKDSWDTDKSKRRKLKALLDERLTDCEVLIGGRTTIDITRKGVDKAYGVRWLSEHLQIPTGEMFYVGDALYEGGNDQVVIATGIDARQTSGPDETLSILDEVLSSVAA